MNNLTALERAIIDATDYRQWCLERIKSKVLQFKKNRTKGNWQKLIYWAKQHDRVSKDIDTFLNASPYSVIPYLDMLNTSQPE